MTSIFNTHSLFFTSPPPTSKTRYRGYSYIQYPTLTVQYRVLKYYLSNNTPLSYIEPSHSIPFSYIIFAHNFSFLFLFVLQIYNIFILFCFSHSKNKNSYRKNTNICIIITNERHKNIQLGLVFDDRFLNTLFK